MISMALVGDVLQGDEVGLALGSFGFPVCKHGLQKLQHRVVGAIRRGHLKM
jgi:hypothetical protein